MMLYNSTTIRNRFLHQSRPARQILRPARHPGACRVAFSGASFRRKRVMAQLEQVLVSLTALMVEGDGSLITMQEQLDRAIETLRVISLTLEGATEQQENTPQSSRLRPARGVNLGKGEAALLAHLAQGEMPETPHAA